MAVQKISADLLYGASQNKTNPGMMRLSLGSGSFLDIAKPLYQKALDGLISGVSYDDDVQPLEVVNATSGEKTMLKFFRICGIDESPLAKISRANAYIAAAEGFDTKKFAEAKKTMAAIENEDF
jgi:hypothetical protein